MRTYSVVTVRNMDVCIGQTGVYMKDVDLGDGFSTMRADIHIDAWGRVKVHRGSTLLFFTDLRHLPSELLMVVSDQLGGRADCRFLTRILTRLTRILAVRSLEASSE